MAAFRPLFKIVLRNITTMPGICTGPVLVSFLSNTRVLDMESFLIISINLSSYEDGDVGNLRKFEYFNDYFRHGSNTQKYDLTCDLRFFKPVTKVKYINNCKEIFDFELMLLFLIYQGMCYLRDHAI